MPPVKPMNSKARSALLAVAGSGSRLGRCLGLCSASRLGLGRFGLGAASGSAAASASALRLPRLGALRSGVPASAAASARRAASGSARLGRRLVAAEKTSSERPRSATSPSSVAGSLAPELAGRPLAQRQHLALDALEAQRQPPALVVDLEDLDLHHVAGVDDLARVLDVVLGELGDVHEPLDAVHDLDERAEADDLGDLALQHVAHVVGLDAPAPMGPPGSASGPARCAGGRDRCRAP